MHRHAPTTQETNGMTASEDQQALDEQVAKGMVDYWKKQETERHALYVAAFQSWETAVGALHSSHRALARIHHHYRDGSEDAAG